MTENAFIGTDFVRLVICLIYTLLGFYYGVGVRWKKTKTTTTNKHKHFFLNENIPQT